MSADLYLFVCPPERIEALAAWAAFDADLAALADVGAANAVELSDAQAEGLWKALCRRDDEEEVLHAAWAGPGSCDWATWSNVWLGQVSYAKASFDGDERRRWYPGPIAALDDLFGGHYRTRPLTPGLRAAITTSYNIPNASAYQRRAGHRGMARPRHVRRWCDANLGRQVFLATM